MKQNLKTQRGNQSARKNEYDRFLRSLNNERRKIWKQIQEAPLEKLEEPYQRGWERFFVLSPEALRRRDAEPLKEALSIISKNQWCRCYPFRRYNWKKRMYVPWEHNIAGLSSRELLKLEIPYELMKYFQVNRRKPLSHQYLRELIKIGWGGKFWFRYPEYIISKVQPYWVTHRRLNLPDLEQRLAEIESVFENPKADRRLDWLRGYNCKRWERYSERQQDLREKRRVEKEIEFEALSFETKTERRKPFMRVFRQCPEYLHKGFLVLLANFLRRTFGFAFFITRNNNNEYDTHRKTVSSDGDSHQGAEARSAEETLDDPSR